MTKRNTKISGQFIDNLTLDEFAKIVDTVWQHTDDFDLEFDDQSGVLRLQPAEEQIKVNVMEANEEIYLRALEKIRVLLLDISENFENGDDEISHFWKICTMNWIKLFQCRMTFLNKYE